MTLPSLILAALAAVSAGPTQGTPQDGTPVLVPTGSVQTPAQPLRRSRASYVRAPRGAEGLKGGNTSRVAAPIRNLVGVRGQQDNHIWGLGLVDGLAGTGDSSALSRQMLRNLLLARGLNVEEGALTSKNLAVVRVEASLPAGIKTGQPINVRVSAYQDAKSLLGGNLMFTELFGADDLVYATASGPVTVGGFTVGGEAASTTKNHNTAGTLSNGGRIVRSVPTQLVDGRGFINLDARPGKDHLGNLVRATDAINDLLPGAARMTGDGKSIQVAVPGDLPDSQHAHYLNSLLALEVEAENVARVVINERTGVIVMGGDVRLLPGGVAHGSLVVEIAETKEVSQPGPLSGGETVPVDRTDLEVTEGNEPLRLVPQAVTLNDVVTVLNSLGATPRDLIAIITALEEGGLLVAELERM